MRSFNLFKRIFVDGNGTYTGFRWWVRWTFAFWCLRKWLEYEGMPKETKDVDEVLKWEKKVAGYHSTSPISTKSSVRSPTKPSTHNY